MVELWELPASEHPFPLPNNSRTEPHLAVKPHVAMGNDLEKKISNYEEIRPKHQKSEMPLVAFTLLVQMAVGAFWAAQWMTDSIPLIPYLLIGACLGLGGFFSFAHLGAKRNAWRAPFHLKKSWLSREILFVGLFGAGWLAGFVLPEMKWVTSLLGVGLIYSMAKVYQLRTMPAWNTWRTTAGFFITSALLGQLAMMNVLQSQESLLGNCCRVAGGGVGADVFSETKSPMDSQQAEGGVDRGRNGWGGDHVRCAESAWGVDQSPNLPGGYD